jgi:hypothetical protein
LSHSGILRVRVKNQVVDTGSEMGQIRDLDEVLARASVSPTVFLVAESDGNSGVTLNPGFEPVEQPSVSINIKIDDQPGLDEVTAREGEYLSPIHLILDVLDAGQ